jgi:hypothetical protein
VRQTRVIWYVMAALLVLLGGGAIVAGKKKGGSAAQGGRAVIVPTADHSRTVVVPPCGTGVAVTSANAAQQADTTGSTRVTLPQGTGQRVVVVPRCPARSGGTFPSAAFVLRQGSKIPVKGDKAARDPAVQDLRSQVLVPQESQAITVVVPACSAKSSNKGSSAVVGQFSSLAVAPPC